MLKQRIITALILLPIALVRVDLRPVLARWHWVVAFAVIEIAIPWVALGSAELSSAEVIRIREIAADLTIARDLDASVADVQAFAAAYNAIVSFADSQRSSP